MNCREVQSEIFAETEGAPDIARRAAVEAHVAHCATCRQVRDDLTTALTAWRSDLSRVTVPDAEREWHAVRRRIRGGEEAAQSTARGSRRSLFAWLSLPLAAAAAVAVFMVSPSPTESALSLPIGETARAEAVEAPGNAASTMVFVDDKSGWLIVLASDATARTE